jgi:hypothetical protein
LVSFHAWYLSNTSIKIAVFSDAVLLPLKLFLTLHNTAFTRGFTKPPAVTFYSIHNTVGTDLGRVPDVQTCGGNTNTHRSLRGPELAGRSSNEGDLQGEAVMSAERRKKVEGIH